MPSVERLARDLANLRTEVRSLALTPRLSHSSIDGGALEIRDDEGNTTGYVGQQFDGTYTVAPVGGSYPTAPLQPLVTPTVGGLRIYWDGTYEDGSPTRMDFRRITLHAVPVGEELDMLSPSQVIGEITTAIGGEITVALPAVEHLVYGVTWTDSGKFSPESEPAFGTPLSLVDTEAWQQHETALAELNDVQLPALHDDLTANEAATDSISSSVADLAEDFDQLSSTTSESVGAVSDLVSIIQRNTASQHLIY